MDLTVRINFSTHEIELHYLRFVCFSLHPCSHEGVNCEENLDECLSNPCQNGGTCDDRNNGYVCYCSLGYAGVHCELDVAVCDTGNHMIKYLCLISRITFVSIKTGSGNKCHNGGQCVEGRGLDFTCNCAPGWQGRFCSVEVDECESSPCLNGGICIDKLASYNFKVMTTIAVNSLQCYLIIGELCLRMCDGIHWCQLRGGHSSLQRLTMSK